MLWPACSRKRAFGNESKASRSLTGNGVSLIACSTDSKASSRHPNTQLWPNARRTPLIAIFKTSSTMASWSEIPAEDAARAIHSFPRARGAPINGENLIEHAVLPANTSVKIELHHERLSPSERFLSRRDPHHLSRTACLNSRWSFPRWWLWRYSKSVDSTSSSVIRWSGGPEAG